VSSPGDRYLLIEFKRPHALTQDLPRWACAAATWEGDRHPTAGRRPVSYGNRADKADVRFPSYAGMLSDARYQLDWLIKALSNW